MKYYLFLFSLVVSSFAYGQSTLIYQPLAQKSKPAYFIDSVRVASAPLNYLKPDDIKDVYVSKDFIDKDNHVYGAIYITTKTPNVYRFIGLNEIKKIYGVETTGVTIYMVDQDFIQETQHFKLPYDFIYKVEIIKGAEFDNLKQDLPNLSIVKIITKPNAPKSTGLMIRGASY